MRPFVSAVVMGETPVAGALQAIDRYMTKCNDSLPMYFGVASYPMDAQNSAVLIQAAARRLDMAKNGGNGTVVSAG